MVSNRKYLPFFSHLNGYLSVPGRRRPRGAAYRLSS